MNKIIPYEQMHFNFITLHYDIHWAGTCFYEGKQYEFKTHDLTDYEKMIEECPCCNSINGSNDYEYCNCTIYVDLKCELIPLNNFHKFKHFLNQKLFEICVGYHWTYPQRKNGIRFIKRKPKWLHNILLFLYYGKITGL